MPATSAARVAKTQNTRPYDESEQDTVTRGATRGASEYGARRPNAQRSVQPTSRARPSASSASRSASRPMPAAPRPNRRERDFEEWDADGNAEVSIEVMPARSFAPDVPSNALTPTQRAARTTRRRALHTHRPLRLSWSAGIVGLCSLGLLIASLWLKGLALSATHRLVKLGDATHGEIGKVNDDIAQTQKKIAALSSPLQLKRWADERGWQLATPDKFDDVTRRPPPAPQPQPTGLQTPGARTPSAQTPKVRTSEP